MSEPRQKEDKMEIMYVCAGHIWGLLSSSSLTSGATVKAPGVNVFLCSPAHNTPDWTRTNQRLPPRNTELWVGENPVYLPWVLWDLSAQGSGK